MIQLNLLPDIKLDYVKAQRTHRLFFSAAVLASAASILILILILSIDGLQKKHLKDLTKDINSETSQLQNKPSIGEILTVQNQLESLTNLHNTKPAANQLFTYLNEVTPTQVSINDFTIDFTLQATTITGTADTLSSVNAYVDTLKATTFTTNINSTTNPAFTNIVLSSFSLNSGAAAGQAVSYTITLSYDKNIFDITQTVKLTVPSQVVTRATSSQTNDLFKASPTPPSSGGGH